MKKEDLDPVLQAVVGTAGNMRATIVAYLRDLADRLEDYDNSDVIDVLIIEGHAVNEEYFKVDVSGWTITTNHAPFIGALGNYVSQYMASVADGKTDVVTATGDRCEEIGRRLYAEGKLEPLDDAS